MNPCNKNIKSCSECNEDCNSKPNRLTTREKLEYMLTQRGMYESQASKVMDMAIPELNKLSDDYKITFDRPADEYPAVIYDLLFISIKPIALNWIDKNIPQAWFREMFV